MLKDDLYTITDLKHSNGTIHAALFLDPAHKIFTGHFPGQPVLPGVCMIQMVREILEAAIHQQLSFLHSGNVKFLALIDPCSVNVLGATITYKVSEQLLSVSATFTTGATVSFKFQGTYLPVRSSM